MKSVWVFKNSIFFAGVLIFCLLSLIVMKSTYKSYMFQQPIVTPQNSRVEKPILLVPGTTTTVGPKQEVEPQCLQGHIVTTEFPTKGRMGNQIHYYANVWIMSRVLGRPGFVPQEVLEYMQTVFTNLTLPSLQSVKLCDGDLGKALRVNQESSSEEFKRQYRRHGHLWLSMGNRLASNFIGYDRRELIKELQFQPEILQQVEETFKRVGAANRIKIGIHVRRQEFVHYLRNRYHLKMVNGTYFKEQMKWYRKKFAGENPIFLVVSDDMDWCRANLADEDDVVLAPGSVGHDLALMANSDHLILDYGSYGTWGSILGACKLGYVRFLNLKEGKEPSMHCVTREYSKDNCRGNLKNQDKSTLI